MDVDKQLLYAVNGYAGQWELLDRTMMAVGHPGYYLIPGLLVLGYWVWLKRQEAFIGLVALAALIPASDFLGAQLKHLVGRSRPCQMLQGINELSACGGTFGFPSNHAVNAAAAAAFFQVMYPASGWVSWPLVVLIGLSRVYVAAHYVTDVLGGWAIGAILGGGAASLLLRWRRGRGHNPEAAS